MMHARNTHQDCEATVIKANRKHQIILNLEVKRIEMEKKMRERYFCFEMSLTRARRLKIVDRQKSLGIYRPQTVDGKEKRKGTLQATSFFFTAQPVAMETNIKLPSLFQDSQTCPRLPTRLSENSKMLQFLTHKKKNKLIMDKEKTKSFPKQTMRARDKETGNNQFKAQFLMKQGSQKLDGSIVDYQERGNEVNQGETCSSNHQNEFVKQLDALSLIREDDEHDRTEGGVSSEDKAKESKQNNASFEDSNSVQRTARETQVTEISMAMAKSENTVKILPLIEPIYPENTSTRAQISSLTTVQELQTWRKSFKTFSGFDPCHNLQGLTRTKSATVYRKDNEVYSFKVRPQTAFSKLTIFPTGENLT